MKSAWFSVVLTTIVVCNCIEASSTPSTVSTSDNTHTTGFDGTTTNSPFHSTTTYKETTGTTHNSTTMETTTLGSFTSDITSVTTQPHGSDPTLSISISSMTQNTGSSGSEASVTAMPPTPSTRCPPTTGFDAASFVGGIILALGVMVILVIIVKCYQHRMSKSELQYSQF